MVTQKVKVSNLILDPKNARVHDKENINNIKKSLATLGQYRPIVVQKSRMMVLAGNGTLIAAKESGWDEIDCYIIDVDDAKAQAIAIADNKIAETSAWDNSILTDILGSMSEDYVNVVGFTADELDDLLGQQTSGDKQKPEVEFSEELLLEHNYVVFYFDNILDWKVVQDKLDLKPVKDLIERKGQPVGVGRVVNGKKLLDLL